MAAETLVQDLATRLIEAAQEHGKARRLRVRQIEMWLRWKHNVTVRLPLIEESVKEIAEAELARARDAATRLLGTTYAAALQHNITQGNPYGRNDQNYTPLP